LKKFTIEPLENLNAEMDPGVGAMHHGAEVSRLGAMDHGAEVLDCLLTWI